MHGSLPRRPTIRGRLVAQIADGFVEDSGVIGIQDRLHGRDLGMSAKRLHGAKNHAASADRTILFWSSRAGTKPASGCDKDGCSPLRFRHGIQSSLIPKWSRGVRIGALPLSRAGWGVMNFLAIATPLLFEHDLRAKASRLSRGKTGSHAGSNAGNAFSESGSSKNRANPGSCGKARNLLQCTCKIIKTV
jgi:hypothetical protein